MIQLVWFKRDLRLSDHQPLAAAAAAGPVLPLYVVEPDYWRQPDVSRRQWLATAGALRALADALAARGCPLVIHTGDVTAILATIHRTLGIARVWAHEETGNGWTFRRDIAVRAWCRAAGIRFTEFSQTGVIRGAANPRNRWAAHFQRFAAEPPVAAPPHLVATNAVPFGVLPDATALGLTDDGCAKPQPGTRRDGLDQLDSFLAGRGADYRRGMSSPLSGERACSRLSVALATGALSVREVLQRLYAARADLNETPPTLRPLPVTAIDSLVSRLHWRSHFTQKLESEPAMEYRALHPAHQAARHATAPDDPVLAAWATGNTGIPFLDACMRSLVATGWLNFRMRAMVQAFASYHLYLDWHASGTRLARLFTDYEPGIHWPQVQMQAGATGINTPRMYNPIKQGLDQDHDGVFTRRWVPELRDVPLPSLHTPCDHFTTDRLGYPPPIVDVAAAAQAAKARLTALRQQPGYRAAALTVYERHGSRARTFDNDDPRPQRASNGPSQNKRQRASKPPQMSFSFD